jgi:SAM-dependent MidA family methyltransferase
MSSKSINLNSLPLPSEPAQQHSLCLQNLLKKIIREQGRITFHDFMQKALYEPGLGYYSAGCHKLGARGDFITAPEISPLFGRSIARALMPLIDEVPQADWLELGAGTGKLAAAILSYLAELQSLPQYYFILEVSADLKQRQKQMLQQQLSAELFAKIVWLDHLPDQFNGIIIANEVLDALAVHRFQITAAGVKEYYVGLDKQNNFKEYLDQPSCVLLKQRIEALQLEEQYSSEINLQQETLLKSLSAILNQGLILFIDYGFPAKEFYHSQRHQGTLMCHYQHRAHSDALFWPGLQDITAHIDFTALARVGLESDLSLLTFSTQSAWLLQAGILDLTQKIKNPKEQLMQQQAISKLISAEEMGELFKVILFGKKIDPAKINNPLDMRHRL